MTNFDRTGWDELMRLSQHLTPKFGDALPGSGADLLKASKLPENPPTEYIYPDKVPESVRKNALRHWKVLKELHEIYYSKNADYGDSAENTYRDFGLIAYVIRLSDKMSRLKSLVKKSESERLVEDEKIEDTLLDMANYAVMAVAALRQQKEK